MEFFASLINEVGNLTENLPQKAYPYTESKSWKDIGYIIKPGEFKTEIDWSDLYGSLKPGTYRLKKNFHYDTDFSLYAQFIIG